MPSAPGAQKLPLAANPYAALLPSTKAPAPGGPGRYGQSIRQQNPQNILGASSSPYDSLVETPPGGSPKSQPTFTQPMGAPARSPAGEVPPDSRTPGMQPTTVQAPTIVPGVPGGPVPGPDGKPMPGPQMGAAQAPTTPPLTQPPPSLPGSPPVPAWMLPPGGMPASPPPEPPIAEGAQMVMKGGKLVPKTGPVGQAGTEGASSGATTDMGMPGGEAGQGSRPGATQITDPAKIAEIQRRMEERAGSGLERMPGPYDALIRRGVDDEGSSDEAGMPLTADSQAGASPYAALAEAAPADLGAGGPNNGGGNPDLPGFIDAEPPPVDEDTPGAPPADEETPAGENWWDDTSTWQDESGAITWLPSDPASMEAFLKAQGWYGTDAARRFANLTAALGKYQDAVADGNSFAMRKQQEKMEQAAKNLKNTEGIPINLDELLKNWGQGLGQPGDEPDPATPGDSTIPGEGTDLGELPDMRYETIPEWMKQMDPENLRAYLDLLNFNLARDDRQLAIDQYKDLFKMYDEDPTRAALYKQLEDPYETLSPEAVQKMKASAAQTYGDANAGITSDIRERAAQLGVNPADLASMELRARSEAGMGLSQMDRDIDLEAARSGATDWERWFNALNGAQQSLLGPYASMYGSLAGLISGTPNLANTGNPMQGVGDYRLQQEMLNEKGPGMDYMTPLITGGASVATSLLK